MISFITHISKGFDFLGWYFGIKNRKIITGIVLTREGSKGLKKLRGPKEIKQTIRTSIHKAIVTGDYGEKNKILGLISYVGFVEKKARNKISFTVLFLR